MTRRQAIVRIDTMKPADIPAVCAIDPTTPLAEADLVGEFARPWSRRWVARQSGEAVAFAVAWHVVDEVHVLNLATRPDRRRLGIGRAVMAEIVAYARTRHARLVLLEVRRSNRAALALYRSVGFSATGLRPRYYADDEDAVEMALSLDPATGRVLAAPDEVRLDS
jgi:ribosomal-protein-alanine N-acetyltransferase